MNKEGAFLKSFPVVGHPSKREVTFAFHSFSENGIQYCRVLTINENVPEFILKYDQGVWQVQQAENMPQWFIDSKINWKLDDLLSGISSQ